MTPTENSEIARLEVANQLGLALVRTVVLINGGAILSILTFAGNSNKEALFEFSVSGIKWSMGAFLLGILTVLVALLVSYVYTAAAPSTKAHELLNRYIIDINLSLASLSLICFAGGVITLICSVGLNQ